MGRSAEIETSAEVRRSRLVYLRQLRGKKARLKEAERFGDDLVVETQTAPAAEAAPADAAPADQPTTENK